MVFGIVNKMKQIWDNLNLLLQLSLGSSVPIFLISITNKRFGEYKKALYNTDYRLETNEFRWI